jgi:hypothetical protein
VAHRYVTIGEVAQKIRLVTTRGEELEVALERLDPVLFAPVALGP